MIVVVLLRLFAEVPGKQVSMVVLHGKFGLLLDSLPIGYLMGGYRGFKCTFGRIYSYTNVV